MTQAAPRLRAGDTFEYRVRAVNAATASENKIHEDSVARQYGFRGGLVPGVTDYAYMTRPALDAFGPEWLERGTMSARFVKPLYDGELVIIRATVKEPRTLALEALNEGGEVCAPGAASVPEDALPPPNIGDFPWRELPSPADRAPADEQSLAIGTVLGSVDTTFTAEAAGRLAIEVPDDHAIYQGPDAVAHPGYLIRFANEVLHRTVRMGPWIHVESETQHFGTVRFGEQLSTRARVVDLFERKGHRFVVLDVATFAGGSRPIQRVGHTAIYQLRPPE
jgi:acyl dehydratase